MKCIATLEEMKKVEDEIKTCRKELSTKISKRTIPTVAEPRGQLFYSLSERKEMKLALDEIRSKLNIATDYTETEKMDFELVKKELKDTKAELDKESKKRSAKDSEIQQRVDQCLKDHGVDCGASHGGNFNGVASLALEDKIDAIISEIEGILFEHSQSNSNPDEIETVCGAYKIHFLLLSHMFSLSRSSRAQMCNLETREEIVQQLEDRCDTVGRLVNSPIGVINENPKMSPCVCAFDRYDA